MSSADMSASGRTKSTIISKSSTLISYPVKASKPSRNRTKSYPPQESVSPSCCTSLCSKTNRKARVAVTKAVVVRLLLIGHTLLTIWRVSSAWNDQRIWLWSLGILIIIFEGQFTILKNGGIEWKWFCPLFAVYLAIVLPLIWFLEISQMNKYLERNNPAAATPSPTKSSLDIVVNALTTTLRDNSHLVTAVISNANIANTTLNSTIENVTVAMTTSTEEASTVTSIVTTTEGDIIGNILSTFNSDTGVVIVEESLVYLIVIGRWLLPRGNVSREALSDLLIDYLAMASDIMELFALFDEDQVRGNSDVTYAILGIWSISFLQFIPVMANRRAIQAEKRKSFHSIQRRRSVQDACGESALDIFVTLTALVLQDGPFLVLRLFIIIYLQILTYSLVFFVLKNIIVVLLLTYKLFSLCTALPCCYKKDFVVEGIDYVDLENPVEIPVIDHMTIPISKEKRQHGQKQLNGITNNNVPRNGIKVEKATGHAHDNPTFQVEKLNSLNRKTKL